MQLCRGFLVTLLVAISGCAHAPPPSSTTGSASSPTTGSASSTAATPRPTTAKPAETAIDCEEKCTDEAGCYEAKNPGKDYHGGGRCVSMCEEMKPDERKAWAATVCKDGGGGDD
jgi:hypothetical protein